ncbi:unnamed protein product [Dovyalis caffra]|uniref:Zinc-ribbon domain-containing protein n=1 Tax=Dovyalis caffra TaxID=77055 RepID=A0AAV1RTJ6_9ROSI|nr:unnamed protein product [Dovyalis caffra]
MNGGPTAKIRFVRCPKCRQVLMEPQDIPVYQCGGCGTHLQVKNRKNNPEVTTSGLHETDAAQKNGSYHVSEDKKASSPNHEETIHSPGECSSDQINGRDHAAPGNCDLENLRGTNSPNELQSNGSDPNGSGDFDNEQPGDFNSSNDQKIESNKNDPRDSDNEHVGGISTSDEHRQNGSGQNESGDCVNWQLIDVNLSSGDQKKGSASNESSDCDHEQLELFNEVPIQQTESGDCNNEQLGGGGLPTEAQNGLSDRNDSSDCNGEQAGFSYKVCSPTKLIHFNNEELSPLTAAEPREVNEGEIQQNDSGDFTNEQLEGVNLSTEAENDRSDQNDSLDCKSDQLGTSYKVCSPSKLAHPKNEELSPLVVAKSNVEVIDESSPLSVAKAELHANNDNDGISDDDCSLTKLALLKNKEMSPLEGAKSEAGAGDERSQLAGAKPMLDACKKSDSGFTKSSSEKSADKEGASVVTAHRPAGESISSDIFVSSPNEQLEKLHESVHHDFDCVQCTDTCEIMDIIEPSSELSGTLIDLSKSPTTRSSRAYYDDCVSSFEGTDDQLPDRPKHPFRNAQKPSNHAASDERPRSEKLMANSNSEMQHHLKNHTSTISDKNHRALKSGKFNHDELVEHTRLTHPARNWRRPEKYEYPSQVPFNDGGSLVGYDNGSPSNQFNNQFHSNPYFHSRDKPTYTEQEKMKLLRMIAELQDQVNILNGKEKGRVTPGVTWKDHYIPSYYDHEALEQVIFDDLKYSSYPGRFRGGRNWCQQSKFSRIPFSAEVAINRNQVDHPLCCCSQDWLSGQLPPPALHHNKVLCKVHNGVNFYNSYGSCPSSPQRHADSEFSIYRREMLSDDQRHRYQEVKKYVRKKHHLAKRHLLPLAGGAPFIMCYCCFKQLQLPADFVLFKRKCHRLRCGACSEVLKFSLIRKTHLVPYTPTADAPPPSEVDEHSDALHRRNLPSTSHATDCPYVDLVSCSEDYGLPFCKSCSTDGDPVYQTSLYAVERSMSYDPVVYNEERRKFILNEHKNKCKNPVEAHESPGPSSSMSKSKKVSSEIEELPGRGGGGSPLHRLMGYSSPSQLVYGYGPSCSSSRYPAKE